MQERGQLLPSLVGQQLRRVGCMFSNPHQSSTSSHNFAMAFIPRQPEYGRDAMGGPLSYPAHISAVSALIKDTAQIGSRLDWEAHAIPRFRRFREEIVHRPTPNPEKQMTWLGQRVTALHQIHCHCHSATTMAQREDD